MKQLAAFIIGGGLTTFLIGPLLITAIPLLIIILAGLIIISFIVPGGWFLSWLTTRVVTIPLHFKIGRYLLGLLLIAVGALMIGVAFGYTAQQAFMFISGGLVTLFSFTPPSILKPLSRGVMPTPGLKINKVSDMMGGAISMEEIRNGVLVTGEECLEVARALVKSLADRGLRVVVIGSSSRIIPEGVKVRGGVADKLDIVGDMLNDHRSIESFAYAYSLANRLRNDDIPLIINACLDNIREVRSGRMSIEDFFKTLPDKIQDRRAAFIKAVVSVSDWFSRDGLKLTEAEGDWQVLYISVRGLPYRQALFSMAYTILTLDIDAVLVVHSPELLFKDINLLAYDSREPWERLFNALDNWRMRGLILVSKSPILSQQTLHLCQTHMATKMSEYFRPLDGGARQLYEAARTLRGGEAIVRSPRGLFRVKLKIPRPADIPPPKRPTPSPEAQKSAGEPESRGGAPEEKASGPTILERLYGERVVDVARILEQARNGLGRVSDSDGRLVKELEDRGLITSLGGTYYTTAAGEEALSEYQRAVRERPPIVKLKTVGQEGGGERPPSSQTIIDSDEASGRLDEHVASYYMAESLFRQQKYGQCVMNCYEFMVNALKRFYNIEKGHLDDIVETLNERGAETGLTIQEARDAKTLLIEASRSLKEGGQVPLTSAQRMLKYARSVLNALERAGGVRHE